MDNPPEHWEIAILGTGLSESILAAALAKAGKKVLHLDENDYYGGDSASLTLLELITWADERLKPPQLGDQTHSAYLSAQRKSFTDIHYSFPSSSDQSAPDPDLMRDSRLYAISLLPCLVPASGPIITSLIASGVSRYGGFCLLNAVAICSPLDDKRPEDEWEIKRVPSSKEDVFKDRSMSLLDKRKLMKFLMFAASDAENPPELEGQEETTVLNLLESKFSLPKGIASAIAFATAHCSHIADKAVPALQRLQRYLRANGRYGNSPFLIGHYGGAGEIAQGFCRTAAVQGATYILGRKIEAITHVPDAPTTPAANTESGDTPQGPHFSIRLDGFANPVTADVVVSTDSYSGYLNTIANETTTLGSSSQANRTHYLVRGVAVLNSPVKLASSGANTTATQEERESNEGSETSPSEDTPGTFLVVFPPVSSQGKAMEPVSALIMGEVSLSCPTDRYVVYLTTLFKSEDSAAPPPNPSELLQPYLDRLLRFTKGGIDNKPLLVCYYNQRLPEMSAPAPSTSIGPAIIRLDSSPPMDAPLTESADGATMEAERIFWEIMKFKKEGDEDGPLGFWPPGDPDGNDSTGADEEW
ncbi:Rab proteins geranylgeranyltransferase component A [Tulasnella sp. 424]|nr:Rab proteins geranylgeranyltransferase component A [Tulasnella sp. 424]KAG8976423.1 Rab proteins geranylgeranyltransferase component A [Tulasnella sp. 425]